MSRAFPIAAALAATLFSASAVAASCIKPSAPSLPDPNTLDAATRNAVTVQVEAYISATNLYLNCLERADATARAEAQQIIQSWNAPVTDIQVVTD